MPTGACSLIHSKQRLTPHIGTSAHGTRRLGTSAVEELLIPVPPRNEQVAIAQALDAVERKELAEQVRRTALHEVFKSLLENLMTGRLRVPEAEAAVAGAGVG